MSSLSVKEPGREADRESGREADRESGREADRESGREADRESGREADRESGREAARETTCAVTAARTGPGRSTSAALSCPNAAPTARPPRPSGPHIAASSSGSTSHASPRLIEIAGPARSDSGGG